MVKYTTSSLMTLTDIVLEHDLSLLEQSLLLNVI
jgi:hypothetical protein